MTQKEDLIKVALADDHLLLRNALASLRTFNPVTIEMIGDIQMETNAQFLFQPTRIEAETTMKSSIGTTEKKRGIDYVFSIAEYEKMINDSDMRIVNFYSIPGKKFFTIGEPRIYIDVEKPIKK